MKEGKRDWRKVKREGPQKEAGFEASNPVFVSSHH